MSFFDEDDEPTRRTPRPRRTAPAGGAQADPQTLWTRRAVAAGVGLLLIIFLAVVINACQDSRRKNALRTYNREAGQIISQSDTDVGAPFFEALSQGASQSPEDLQTQISSLRATADTNLKQAKDLSSPGDLTDAQQSLLVALELRRDGLQYDAERIATALGNEGDVADQAISGIAGQMQAFLASDVLIRTRVTTQIRDILKDNDVVADPATTKGFLQGQQGFSWLNPSFVASKLGTRLSSGGGSSGGGNTGKIAPGTHGNGLTSTKVGGVTLQPGADGSNKVPLSGSTDFVVEFANQGENPETDVKVNVTLQGGTGKDITGSKTVDLINKGESATVTIPLSRKPTSDIYTVNVEVKAVPGEKKTDNNKSTYNVLFQ